MWYFYFLCGIAGLIILGAANETWGWSTKLKAITEKIVK